MVRAASRLPSRFARVSAELMRGGGRGSHCGSARLCSARKGCHSSASHVITLVRVKYLVSVEGAPSAPGGI